MVLDLLEKTAAGPDIEASQPQWPSLELLRLGSGAVAGRLEGIGGSDANVILSGNAERVRQLWLEKRGEAEPADLSDHLPAMLACWTEPFNRLWFEKIAGRSVTGIGKVVHCRSTTGAAARSTGWLSLERCGRPGTAMALQASTS